MPGWAVPSGGEEALWCNGESKHLVPEDCGEVEGTEMALPCPGAQGRGERTLKVENEGPLGSCPKGCPVQTSPNLRLPDTGKYGSPQFLLPPLPYSSTHPGGGARGQG